MRWLLVFLPLLAFAKNKSDDFLIMRYPHAGTGLFATVTYVLGALELYERGTFKGVIVNFYKVGLYYEPGAGSNWWSYYFEPICLPTKKKKDPRIMTLQEVNQVCRAGVALSKERKAELLKKHVKVKPHIQEKIENFIAEQFGEKTIIGVHFRGTDKILEAPRVSFEAIFEALDALDLSESLIFVATDEAAFLEEISERYPGKVISTNSIRSTDGKPIHFESLHKYRVGEEAVIDCMLLSRCDFLIRTLSTLSQYSTYFNPHLPGLLIESTSNL